MYFYNQQISDGFIHQIAFMLTSLDYLEREKIADN